LTPLSSPQAASVIQHNFTWTPFHLTFEKAHCNYGGDDASASTSFIALLDGASQKAMAAFVKRMEDTLIAHGIPVYKRRAAMELFHCTIGVVDASYPTAKALTAMNTEIRAWNADPMVVDSFTMIIPPHEFHATTDA
jgi:archaellum biogenesis ATPase FlaH